MTQTTEQEIKEIEEYYRFVDINKTLNRYRAMLWDERCEHKDTQRKLKKAEHDRDRYFKRIKLLDGKHMALCREYHAVVKEKEILEKTLGVLEKQLIKCEEGRDEA